MTIGGGLCSITIMCIHRMLIHVQISLQKNGDIFARTTSIMTVFVRNAENLSQLLTKAPKIRNGNKNFDFGC
jgi:hypothetical protein